MSQIIHRSLRTTPAVAVSAQGAYITDASGQRYLDACGGAAVSCLGHAHPDVLAAMHRQIDRLAYAHTSFFTSDTVEQLAEQLVRTAPGSLKIFFPMLCGEVVGMLVGIGVGTLLGMEPFQVFFFIVLPIMAGGVGEGAIPLSMGYAALMHMEQGVALGRVLPMVMLGSLTAIVISGCLNQLGKRFPHLTGEGQLMPNRSHETRSLSESEGVSGKTDVGTLASGALLAVLLYMMGMLGHKLIGLPAPVGMLFLAVLLKLANVVSPRLQEGSQMVYKFFRTAVTYPILFAVGVAITPWQELVNAFTLTNLLVIVSTVSALVATGFLVGKKIGMHPIDVAIVSCCQSGQGGTGDVAILTSGNRMNLMPFAQIATRIGGAINVSLGLLFLSHFLA